MSVAPRGRSGLVAIVAAILLPPLGVWLVHGIGPAFWIALALTCLAFVPGIVFSLVVIFTPGRLAARRLPG